MDLKRRRGLALAALAVVTTVLVAPLSAGGQDEIAFTPGPWTGSVFFAGSIQSDSPNDTTLILATLSTITIDLVVDESGTVTDGTMQVDVSWIQDGVGTSPDGQPYHITSDHEQTGTLAMSGTVERLVATGTLSWVFETFDTEGNSVFDGPRVRSKDQVWVFEASQSDCGLLTGSLVEASGIGLVFSAKLPPEFSDGDQTTTNELVAVSRIWSKSDAAAAEDIATDVAILNDVANMAIAGEDVTSEELIALVIAFETLAERLAALELCELEALGLAPGAGEDFVAEMLRNLLFKALENSSELEVQELIALLNIGARAGALSGPEEAVELFEAFEEALTEKLAEAVDGGYYGDVEDIAVAAGSHGFTDLYADATKALKEEP